MLRRVTPETLDHVALWVADRDRIADFATAQVGMHVVDRTDAFTLVGSEQREPVRALDDVEAEVRGQVVRHPVASRDPQRDVVERLR